MSFFGGDHSKAHFVVGLRGCNYNVETSLESRKRRQSERAVLKEAGFKTQTFFQFSVKDEVGKARQKKNAETYAKNIKNACGVEMEVCEGFFL